MVKEEVMTFRKVIRIVWLIGLHSVSACSHTNVQSEWDCPKQEGFGCMKIEEADRSAVSRASVNVLENKSALPLKITGDYEIWFAEYEDADQNLHGIRNVRYKQ